MRLIAESVLAKDNRVQNFAAFTCALDELLQRLDEASIDFLVRKHKFFLLDVFEDLLSQNLAFLALSDEEFKRGSFSLDLLRFLLFRRLVNF